MKKSFFLVLVVLLSVPLVLFAKNGNDQKDEKWVRFVGTAEIPVGYIQRGKGLADTSYISLSEVFFGVEWKPSENILVHLTSQLSGGTQGSSGEAGLNDELSVGVWEAWFNWTPYLKVPIHIKAGIYELPVQKREWGGAVTSSWVDDSVLMTNGAVELGFTWEFFSIGVGMYESDSDVDRHPSSKSHINDAFAYATIDGIDLGPVKFSLNIGFASHAGDSELSGGGDYDKKLMVLTGELALNFFNIHLLFGSAFRLERASVSGVSFNTKNAFRVELGYNFDKHLGVPISITAFGDIRTLDVSNDTTKRFGGIIIYNIADFASVLFEALFAVDGPKNNSFTIGLILEIPDHKIRY